MSATERSLEGRRAVVTGAARGLGRAYAVALTEAGARVALCDVAPAVEAVAADLEGGRGWIADVSRPEDVRRFVDGAAEHLGGIDLVVNNAATMRSTDPAADPLDQAVEDYHSVMDVNLFGTFLIGRAVMPHLVAGGGDLINVTTDHIHTCGYPIVIGHDDAGECRWAGGPRPPIGGAAFDVYDASKWGVKGLTLCWAAALAPHGVRVNAFGMGATNTEMYRSHLGDTPVPSTTMAPEQVAAVLLELLEEGPSGRTGDSIQLWAGHPCVLPPPSLDGEIMAGLRA